MFIAKIIKVLTLVAFTSVCFASNEDIPKILLKYNAQSYNDGNQSYLVFNFSNTPHWHTYWKNPGDAGFGLNLSLQVMKQKLILNLSRAAFPKKIY